MPRQCRQMIEGGLYHVYNRFSRGEDVFGDADEAMCFVRRLREVKARDGFLVFAWCVMSNHFHLALRTSPVPLSRTMHCLQNGYARDLQRAMNEKGLGDLFGDPQWWRRDREIVVDHERPYVDVLGRSTGLERPKLLPEQFITLACGHLEIDVLELASRRQDRATARMRRLIVSCGIERWEQRAGELAAVLRKHPVVVSRWVRDAWNLRNEDRAFAAELEGLDLSLSKTAIERLDEIRASSQES